MAKADNETVKRISRGRHFTAAELEELGEDYGRQLLPLPAEALDASRHVRLRTVSP